MYRQIQRKSKLETPKRRCHRCHGSGTSPCRSCGGSGRVATSKDNFGAPVFSRCTACFGNKSTRCSYCAGVGFV